MRARKVILGAALLIATVAAFVALVDFWKMKSAQDKLAQSFRQSEYTYQQCRVGDYATSKKAILAHLEVLISAMLNLRNRAVTHTSLMG